MGITSLQVCMDPSDWLQGTISEEGRGGGGGMDSSPITTPTGDEMLTCSRPLMERRLRPQHEQALKCPRCESTHTKFCYYNNYSLSQPRYFCKSCRRYWTKGGTLRNIPVGGGCRKNKKVSSKKPSTSSSSDNHNHSPSSPLLLNQPNVGMSSPLSYVHNQSPNDLHLAFSDQLHFASLHGMYGTTATPSYLVDHHPTPIDNKYEALLGGSEGFISNEAGFHGSFGMPGGVGVDMESCQRLMLPYDMELNNETKPHAKMLSLEWHDHQHQHQQPCNSDAGKDTFGYSFGSWMNGYGSSAATNPLV